MGDELEPAPFTIWKHYRGDRYMVICCGEMEDDFKETMVVYQHLKTGRRWIRPLVEFMSKFEGPK